MKNWIIVAFIAVIATISFACSGSGYTPLTAEEYAKRVCTPTISFNDAIEDPDRTIHDLKTLSSESSNIIRDTTPPDSYKEWHRLKTLRFNEIESILDNLDDDDSASAYLSEFIINEDAYEVMFRNATALQAVENRMNELDFGLLKDAGCRLFGDPANSD